MNINKVSRWNFLNYLICFWALVKVICKLCGKLYVQLVWFTVQLNMEPYRFAIIRYKILGLKMYKQHCTNSNRCQLHSLIRIQLIALFSLISWHALFFIKKYKENGNEVGFFWLIYLKLHCYYKCNHFQIMEKHYERNTWLCHHYLLPQNAVTVEINLRSNSLRWTTSCMNNNCRNLR